jgi:serine/threonine protein kinase
VRFRLAEQEDLTNERGSQSAPPLFGSMRPPLPSPPQALQTEILDLDLHPNCIPSTHLTRSGDLLELPALSQRLGPWELLEEIGRGGMGVVYKARNDAGKLAAIKIERFPTALRLDDPPTTLINEYAFLTCCEHSGILGTSGLGREEGRDFVVLDFVDGHSLADLIAHQGKTKNTNGLDLDCPRVCAQLVIELGRAVRHMHERGILHRDIKPANVLLTEAGELRLIDFGLACEVGAPPEGLNANGGVSILGTPEYMAPEQARNLALDERCDIYAMGALLFELMTGRRPLEGDSSMDVLRKVGVEQAPDPRIHVAGLPAKLAEICMRAMDLDRDARFASVKDMLRELTRFCRKDEQRHSPRRQWLQRSKRGARRLAQLAAASVVAVGSLGLGAHG